MKVTSQGCGKQSSASIKIENKLACLVRGNDSYEFVGEVTVGLKKRTRANAVSCSLSSISKKRRADDNQDFLCTGFAVAGIRFAKGYDSGNLGQGGAKFFRPLAHGSAASRSCAPYLQQELCVLCVGEELNLPNTLRNFAGSAALP